MSNPRSDGFKMPGEFEHHECTWLAFPHRSDNWRNNAVPAQKALCELANLISVFEKVIMIVPKRHMKKALDLISTDVQMVIAETDDAWVRDTGATFVTDGNENRGICWGFNAWGGLVNGLYSSWQNDE